MATRATIAKLDNNGVKAIYLHSDGYLEYAGRILDEHYQDESKVDELLSHGDVSSLNENIGEKLPFNDYMLFHEKKQCRFYHRDRGEDKKEAATLGGENELVKFATEKCDAEYIYMFAYGSWYVYDVYNNSEFVELEDEIAVIGIR
jgi:hypothetical protein